MSSPPAGYIQERPSTGNSMSTVLSSVAYAPIQLSLSLVSRFFSALRPWAPQIIPLLVCTLFIPFLVFLSASAGWIVWRSVAVAWEAPLYLQYGDGREPYSHVSLPALVAQQPYDILLSLTVPTTDSNYGIGNFMTTLVLSTSNNQTLTSVRRPGIILPPRWSLFSSKSSVVDVAIPLLSAFIPGTTYVNAAIEIGRRDSWTALGAGERREISVVTASLRGAIVNHGVRGLVTRFPFIVSIGASFVFFAILTTILAACTLPSVLGERPDSDVDDLPVVPSGKGVSPPAPPSDSDSDKDEKPTRRRRKSKASRSSSRQPIVKSEEAPTTVIPPAVQPVTPLRRRRSAHSETFMGIEG